MDLVRNFVLLHLRQKVSFLPERRNENNEIEFSGTNLFFLEIQQSYEQLKVSQNLRNLLHEILLNEFFFFLLLSRVCSVKKLQVEEIRAN